MDSARVIKAAVVQAGSVLFDTPATLDKFEQRATEAAAAVLQWTFTTLPVDEVVALTHPGNAASQRVLAKLGFESAGEVAPSHGRTMAMFAVRRPALGS